MTEERWLQMTPDEQAQRLGHNVKKLAIKGVLGPFAWQCKRCSEANVRANTACKGCSAEQKDGAFGGFVFPSTNKESFEKLMAFYDEMGGGLRIGRITNRKDKRKQNTMKMLETEDAWQCKLLRLTHI